MQTYPVFFNPSDGQAWNSQAFRANGKWHLVPRHLSDHLGLDWKTQHEKIRSSEFEEGMGLIPIPSARGPQDTLTLTLPYFGAWMLSIKPSRVPEAKRSQVLEMRKSLLDALERQLGAMFGLPGMMEAEDFLRLPLQPQSYSGMTPAQVQAAREKVMADPPAFQAARFLKVGLAASKVAPLVNRSIYWARQQARLFRRIGFVPLPLREQRLLDQPSLFGEG